MELFQASLQLLKGRMRQVIKTSSIKSCDNVMTRHLTNAFFPFFLNSLYIIFFCNHWVRIKTTPFLYNNGCKGLLTVTFTASESVTELAPCLQPRKSFHKLTVRQLPSTAPDKVSAQVVNIWEQI